MDAPAERERLDDRALREGWLKHAVKTALACCLSATLALFFQLPSHQLAVVFAFMLMALGMPSPRINWLMTHVATSVSSLVCALILITFHAAPALYLILTLTWIFICMLLTNWFPLPAALGAMAAAIGLFIGIEGSIGATIDFLFAYQANLFIAGASVTLFYTLLWPNTLQHTFVDRLAAVYARLEDECREAAQRLRTGQVAKGLTSFEDWAPFRPLRKMLSPDTHRETERVDPFLRMIVACRNLNLHVWYFNQSITPAVIAQLPTTAHHHLAGMLDRCADHLREMLQTLLERRVAPAMDSQLLVDATFPGYANRPPLPTVSDALLQHGVHRVLMHRIVDDLREASEANTGVVGAIDHDLPREFLAIRAFAVGKPLITVNAVRSGTKLLILLLLLLAEEMYLQLPGSSQVAFFAVFFASTANLGKQSRTDVLGITGLMCGFAFGLLAATMTTRMPFFPLVLMFVLLGELIASYIFQSWPKYGVAGLQAGMALPFAYLAASGPAWGSFVDVRTRFAGLVLAGCTAILVHAYLWPVWPLRTLRFKIARTLRDTAESLRLLFADFTTWKGPPASLGETFHLAHDLIEDARYLAGSDEARGRYFRVIALLQEIDGYLAQIKLLMILFPDDVMRGPFLAANAGYLEQALALFERVALQFEDLRLPPVDWSCRCAENWDAATEHESLATDAQQDDHRRTVVLAECLDQIARSLTAISVTVVPPPSISPPIA